jgi:hypothetical protein
MQNYNNTQKYFKTKRKVILTTGNYKSFISLTAIIINSFQLSSYTALWQGSTKGKQRSNNKLYESILHKT